MKTLRLLVVVLIAGQSTSAQSIAKYAGEFLSLGVGGRALGLGSSYVALANDASAGYWNSAALARIHYPEVMLMHDERFGGMLNYDYGAVAIPYGTNATIGLSIMRLGVDGLVDNRGAGLDADGNIIRPDGQSPLAGIDYSKITYFTSADWVLYASYARTTAAGLMYGLSVKLLRESVAEYSATGIGFDVGFLFSPAKNLFVGVNAQDITTTLVAWSDGTNELISPTLKIGTTYSFELLGGRFAPVVDVDTRFENRQYSAAAHLGPISFDPHAGLEFDFKNTLALRIGYSDVKQMTLGAGLHLRKIDIDYSFARFGKENDLGDTHRISLRFIFQEDRFARTSETKP